MESTRTGEKGSRWESGTMLSLCMGAVFDCSLGNREEENGDDQSQETCLNVEFQIRSLRIVFLTCFLSLGRVKSCASIGAWQFCVCFSDEMEAVLIAAVAIRRFLLPLWRNQG